MCRYMSVSVAAGGEICLWGVVMDEGSGGRENDLVDVISCILVHSGDGHYLQTRSDS